MMELEMYLHCKHCLGKDQPSGLAEVGMKDNMFYAICSNCKREIVKLQLDEHLKATFACGCSDCNKKG